MIMPVTGRPLEKRIRGGISNYKIAASNVPRLGAETQQRVRSGCFATFDHFAIVIGESPRDDRGGSSRRPENQVRQRRARLIPVQIYDARRAAETVHGDVISCSGPRRERDAALPIVCPINVVVARDQRKIGNIVAGIDRQQRVAAASHRVENHGHTVGGCPTIPKGKGAGGFRLILVCWVFSSPINFFWMCTT